MSIRIYDLDRKHVIDTEFGKIFDQYRDLMGEYEIPWNDDDWWYRKPDEVKCYEIMGNLYSVDLCWDGRCYVYTKEKHCNYTYGHDYDSLLDAYEGILDEFRRRSMEVLELRKFLIQDDIYKLEILEEEDGRELYKVYRNGELLAEGDRYSNALRVIITAYEIPAKEGRAYIMEGTEYQIIPNEDCCTLIYKYRIDSSNTMRVFDDEWHCLNWILCGYHYRD